MTEEQEDKPEKKPAEVQPVDKSEEFIGKATEAAERLEKANKQLEKLLIKQEKIQIEQTLSGTATAGTHKPTEEEKEIEGAKKLLEGSGFGDELFDKKPDGDS